MDWRLLARSFLLYTILAASITTVIVLALTDGAMPMFVLFIGGLSLVALAIGASEARPPGPANGGGSANFEAFPEENPNQRTYLAIDRIGALYGIGLVVFGGTAFTMGGSLPL